MRSITCKYHAIAPRRAPYDHHHSSSPPENYHAIATTQALCNHHGASATLSPSKHLAFTIVRVPCAHHRSSTMHLSPLRYNAITTRPAPCNHHSSAVEPPPCGDHLASNLDSPTSAAMQLPLCKLVQYLPGRHAITVAPAPFNHPVSILRVPSYPRSYQNRALATK